MPGTQKHVACPLCGGRDERAMTAYAKDHLVCCASCGFVHSERIPAASELEAFYGRYPRTEAISPITLERYDEWLQRFGRWRSTGNIIDVGAGNGYFAERAKLNGWKSYATEYEALAVAICKSKGIETHQGGLDTAGYADGMFDVICSIEVVEHLSDPAAEIRQFNRILRKGGLVYVTTPNLRSLSHLYHGAKWSVFNYPEHLGYFTPRTLRSLFERNGFKLHSLRTTGISADRFFESRSESPMVTDEHIRRRIEGNPLGRVAKKVANTLLDLSKRGDTIKAEFVKV